MMWLSVSVEGCIVNCSTERREEEEREREWSAAVDVATPMMKTTGREGRWGLSGMHGSEKNPK